MVPQNHRQATEIKDLETRTRDYIGTTIGFPTSY